MFNVTNVCDFPTLRLVPRLPKKTALRETKIRRLTGLLHLVRLAGARLCAGQDEGMIQVLFSFRSLTDRERLLLGFVDKLAATSCFEQLFK